MNSASGNVLSTSCARSLPRRATVDAIGKFEHSIGAVSVRVNGDSDAKLACALVVTPVEIEPIGVDVEFDRRSGACCLLKHPLKVEPIAIAAEQEPSSRMAEDRRVRIAQRTADALSLLMLGKIEVGVDGSNNKVERCQDFVWVVERAIGQNVALDAMQDADAKSALVERLDGGTLLGDAFDAEASSIGCALAVVADGDVLESQLCRSPCHFLEGVLAVAPIGVDVQHTAHVVPSSPAAECVHRAAAVRGALHHLGVPAERRAIRSEQKHLVRSGAVGG